LQNAPRVPRRKRSGKFMEAIKLIEQYWRQLKGHAVYAQHCVETSMQAPACRNFWTLAMIAAFVIAVLLILYVVKRVIGAQLDFYRERKRLAAREVVADDEVMNQHRWSGNDPASANLSQEEIAARIRQVVKSGKPPAGG
jgi:hypothetical protein